MTQMTTQEHTNLSEVQANSYVDGVYSLLNPQVGTTRAAKPYLK